MFVSIIVPLKEKNDYIKECIAYCHKLKYQDFELIILPDNNDDIQGDKVRVIATGPIGPSEKRDKGVSEAKGEILAFLDDDTYPVEDWLTEAVKIFKEDENIAAVGGPAVTPPSDNILQKASGRIYSSLVVGGVYNYRYIPKKRREVDDYPTCNILVRKSIMEEVGGFDVNYWPGEDTVLCLKITKQLKKKIIYAPQVLVFHHRREVFYQHLKQIWQYAQHRGYFVKIFPETSLRLAYFLPSLFSAYVVFGGFSFLFSPLLFKLYSFSLLLYLLIVGFTSWGTEKIKNLESSISFTDRIKLLVLVFAGIIASHFVYGVFFIKGLLTKKLVSKLEE